MEFRCVTLHSVLVCVWFAYIYIDSLCFLAKAVCGLLTEFYQIRNLFD